MSAPHDAFARRLHLALDRASFPKGRARTGALAVRYAVTRETARKWLSGLALPELGRIIEIAIDFNTSVEWLATGRLISEIQNVVYPTDNQHSSFLHVREQSDESRLLEIYRGMHESKRKLLIDFLSA